MPSGLRRSKDYYYKYVFIAFYCLYISAELRCGINEVAVDCPRDCYFDSCPKSRYHDKTPCPRPEKCPLPTCKCIFNYRRADNGTCIPTTECRKSFCCIDSIERKRELSSKE